MATMTKRNHYMLTELQAMPTISQTQTADLKVDTGTERVWLERTTVEDGEPYDHKVTVEEYDGQRWETVEEYPAVTLHRELRLPGVRDFTELVDVVRAWDFSTMSHRVVPNPELVPAPVMIGDNELGPFCTVQNMETGERASFAVVAKPAVVEALEHRIVTDDDRLSFQVIVHKDTGRALVIADHNYIIGSHYLAYVDADTVPMAL